MAIEFVQHSAATATTGALVAVDLMDFGTATNVAVQVIKFGYGTDGVFNEVATGQGVPVATGPVYQTQQMSTATSPVSVGTWTATGIVRIDTHSTATLPVSLAVLPTTATLPVAVGTWTATGQVLTAPLASATGPVSVGTWTATGIVNVATDRTYPVAEFPTATGALADDIATATTILVGSFTYGFATTATGLLSWHRARTSTTGNWLVNVQNTATVAISGTVNIAAATGSITVIQGTATNLNVAMSSAATIPVTVATAPVFNVQQMSTATSPVSVGTWTATGAVFIDNKATATIFVAVQNTATVNVANTATVNVANTATVAITGNVDANVGGRWAHDATSTGNPTYIGAIAETTFPTGVADGDVVQLTADKHGRIINMPFSGRDNIIKAYITASATTVATLATGGAAGVFRDLVAMVAFNTATIEARIRFRSSSTATEFFLNLAPDGGGIMFNPPRPWTQAIAATTWDITLTSPLTATDALHVGAMFMETT